MKNLEYEKLVNNSSLTLPNATVVCIVLLMTSIAMNIYDEKCLVCEMNRYSYYKNYQIFTYNSIFTQKIQDLSHFWSEAYLCLSLVAPKNSSSLRLCSQKFLTKLIAISSHALQGG